MGKAIEIVDLTLEVISAPDGETELNRPPLFH